MLINNVFLIIVLLLALLILSYFISWALLHPIYKMNSSLDVADVTRFAKLPARRYMIDEIYQLTENFNQLLGRIEDLIDELLVVNRKKHEVEASKTNAEIQALQAQIHPHFLQNTLNNVIHLVQEQRSDQAVRMIRSLGRLFRYGISRGETIIPLHEEIKYAKAYIMIMEMRYGDGIRFTWRIDDKVLQYSTLKLILQPLIENAIHHGFHGHQENGTIEIACTDAGEQIVITVTDNGKGMTAQQLAALKKRLLTGERSGSMGIFNVRERIQLFCGEPYGVTFNERMERGTQVILNIPKLREDR